MLINYLLVFSLVLLRRPANGDDSAAESEDASYEDVMDADDSPLQKPKSNEQRFIPNKDELNIKKPLPDLNDMNDSNDGQDDHPDTNRQKDSPNYSQQPHSSPIYTGQPHPLSYSNERIPLTFDLYNNPAPLYRQLPVYIHNPMMAKSTHDMNLSPEDQNYQQSIPNLYQMMYNQPMYNQATQHARMMYPANLARTHESPFINHMNYQFRNLIDNNHFITFEPVKEHNERDPKGGDRFFYDKWTGY